MRVWFPLMAAASTALAGPIGSAKEDEAAPAAQPDDATLLRALLWAFEPAPLEVRAQAVEDLGLLGDVRALNPLAQLCLDPNPLLARAALRAVATMRHPRAEEILSNVVRHPTIAEGTKIRALELLPYQNTWSAVRFVRQVASQVPVTPVVVAARRLAATLPAPPPLSTTVAPLAEPAPAQGPATAQGDGR